MERIFPFVALISFSLMLVLAIRNAFRARRYKGRFAEAFLEEFKHAYPDSASLLTPDVAVQIAHTVMKNKNLAGELNNLERQIIKRPEIGNKSPEYLDADYSPETRELISDLLKKKIELAGKVFDCLPPKLRTQIHKKAELIDETAAEAELSDEELRKKRKRDEERAEYVGLKAWRFTILMSIYDISIKASSAIG